MAKRDPHHILGVERGASPSAIKAAWRRLARVHHPDLTGDDPAASRVATRRMAEINEAYAELVRDGRAATGDRGAGGSGGSGGGEGTEFDEASRRRGPPRPRPTRPVTGRLDTSPTFRPRNQTSTGARTPLRGHAPPRAPRWRDESPRASTPTGPAERERMRGFEPAPAPALEAARDLVVEFGKFHGHTLGEIARFEPSYIDWLSRTVQRDPELAAAARTVKADLDRRGVVRRVHPTPERPTRPVWRPGS